MDSIVSKYPCGCVLDRSYGRLVYCAQTGCKVGKKAPKIYEATVAPPYVTHLGREIK